MIFIVDDTADYRFLLEQVFKRFLPQHAIRFFSSGDALYTYIISANEPSGEVVGSGPDLILLDLNMPGIGGYKTLLFLKQHPQWQSIPVVMMTNTGSSEEIEQCYKGGVNSFLTKPSEFTELKQLMEMLCSYWLVFNKLPVSKIGEQRDQQGDEYNYIVT